ncbi:MAG: shikimate dehydrogenase [Leptolyngbyaceae cyanobacterium SL_7_1]|nr:shikimate dehydrogenase [Leptolyngbyaceae cyanobacterium SL_7_1]
MITGNTQLLGVIGYPIQHSLSPVMHNAAIDSLGLDYTYVPFAVEPQCLEQAIAGLSALGVEGFNVTIPHKQAVMPLLSEISPIAQAIGAVNTVYRTAAGWGGTNTDVVGFLTPLRTHALQPGAIAVVLGNGGAARAVVAGCGELGYSQIAIVGRDRTKLEQFLCQGTFSKGVSIHLWSELVTLLPYAQLVVNTTPIGMHPQVDQSPLSQAELDRLPTHAVVYDLIYTPHPTLLLHQAMERGLEAIDGLEMLIHQGAAAWDYWLQRSAPIAVMRSALHDYLSASR